MNQTTLVTRLALMLVMVGALALAGCSGGSDGGEGPGGMVGLQGDPGAAGETGAQGEQGEPGIAGAQGDPGAAGETGAQGEQGEPGIAGAPANPDAVMDLIWEAVFKPKVEMEFKDALGTAATVTRAELAIDMLSFATKYRAVPKAETATQREAWVKATTEAIGTYLTSTFGPTFTTIQAKTATTAFNEWRMISLPGTRARAAMVLMGAGGADGADGAAGPAGPAGAAASVTDVMEAIAASGIRADYVARIDALLATSNDRLSRSQIVSAIMATANEYGLMGATTAGVTAAVEAATTSGTFDIRKTTALGIFDILRAKVSDGTRQLSATAVSAAVHIATLVGTTSAPTDPTLPPTMPDPMTLAALLMEDGVTVEGVGASRDKADFVLPSTAEFMNEGGGIESFSERVGDGFGGFGDNTYETLGLWADGVAAFTVLSGTVGSAALDVYTAVVGKPVDPPAGSGKAYWNGKFTGIHMKEPGPAFDKVGDTTLVKKHSSVMGDVSLDVTFTNGEAKGLDATFSNFVGGADTYEHNIPTVPIGRRGGFSDDQTATKGAIGHDLAGQFYEADGGQNAGGSVSLLNGVYDAMGKPAGEALVISSFGKEGGHYHIEGVFVATE